MAKGIYFGVNGQARRSKKIYYGVDGVPRKVKKAYVGVNGSPRLVFSSEISYAGTITPLSRGRQGLQAGANTNYAVFMGGTYGTSDYSKVDAYNMNLTRINAPILNAAHPNYNAGGSIGNYTWYCPLPDGSKDVTISGYDTSLTRVTATTRSVWGICESDSSDTENYSFIALGSTIEKAYMGRTINKSFVTGYASVISSGECPTRGLMCGSDCNNYVVVGGGVDASLENVFKYAGAWRVSNATAYGNVANLSTRRYGGKGGGNKAYSILAGGYELDYTDWPRLLSTVDAYNNNLVQHTTYLSAPAGHMVSAYTEDYAYFIYYGMCNSFDTSLVRRDFAAPSVHRTSGAITSFNGDKLIYGGGYTSSPTTYHDTVDVYSY